MREGGGTQAAEEGQRRIGRGVGTWWCLGEGGLGREPGAGIRGERAELGRRGPSPRLYRGGACDSESLPPPSPLPGLEPPPTPEARDGAGAAAASRPSLPHHPSPPRWTSGPWAPHRQGSGNPPRPARLPSPAPPSLQSPQPSSRPDFRLPLDAPSPFPPSPPPPAWSGVGGRGGVRSAPSPPRPP